jgi:hypothetical protein
MSKQALYRMTPHEVNKLFIAYNTKSITFREFKERITKLLKQPIDWYFCSHIKSFKVNLDCLVITAITRQSNEIKINMYYQ